MKKAVLKISVLAALFATFGAEATLLTFNLNSNYGADATTGDVLVTITEASTPGDVHIAISNITQGYLNKIFFNYSAQADIADATIDNFIATSGNVGAPSVQYNGSQGFALILDFPNQAGPNFTYGEAVSFNLSTNANLTVAGFNSLGDGPSGDDHYVAAHINGSLGEAKIGDGNGGVFGTNELVDDAPITTLQNEIPEPSSVGLLGLGLIGLTIPLRKTVKPKNRS